MRRPIPTVVLRALLVVGATVALASCRGQVATTPTVASVNFTAKAQITVDDQGQLVLASDSNSSDPGTLAAGSVVTIGNDSGQDQRVTGTLDGKASIDTGTLHRGERVTVVLGTAGSVELWPNADGSGPALAITVSPRPA
jgi:hypothetical protein